uniref:Putative methyltransferase n=1 Tax=viral metagenome TaxID=1070528 RepID=A0A6M3IR06_9ZZZZ
MIQTSVFKNEPALLKALIDIHLQGNAIECDPMFFKGNFYKDGVATPAYIGDIEPISLGVMKYDARNLPFDSNSMGSMILDPPFMFGGHGKQGKYYSSKTHGILKGYTGMETLYKDIIAEAYRVLSRKGILIFKTQDFTDSKTTFTHCLVWEWARSVGFYAKDLAIFDNPKNKVSNHLLKQRHLRKVHSYFWIFEKNAFPPEVKE